MAPVESLLAHLQMVTRDLLVVVDVEPNQAFVVVADVEPNQVFALVAGVESNQVFAVAADVVATDFAIPSLPVGDVVHVVFGLAPIALGSNVKLLVHLVPSDVAAIASGLQHDVSAWLHAVVVGTFAPLPAVFSLLLDKPATAFVALLDLLEPVFAIVFQPRRDVAGSLPAELATAFAVVVDLPAMELSP